MKLDGISIEDQDRYFNPNKNKTSNSKGDDEFKQKMAKYAKMAKLGMNEDTIRYL